MGWSQVTISASSEQVREAISSFLFDLGSEGVTEGIEKSLPAVTGFFPSADKTLKNKLEVFLKSLQELNPKEKFVSEWKEVPEDNWSEKYKEFYKAQKLSHRFYLKPAWDKKTQVPIGSIPIILDPGQAFGTGLHPSTRLSIRLIEECVSLYPDCSKIKAIDVGTGTGILAMVAKHLGVGNVCGVDIDPIAVEVAKENLKLNHITGVELSDKPFKSFKEPFDLIISNILLETHFELAKDYKRLLVPGGQLILSGLLGGQKRALEEVLIPLGFVPLVSCALQEWVAYSYTLRE